MDELDEAVAELWQSMRPVAVERAERIQRRCADATDDDSISSDAHKLAGALGMYGLPEAGAVAREIDELVTDGALTDERRAQVQARAERLVELLAQNR